VSGPDSRKQTIDSAWNRRAPPKIDRKYIKRFLTPLLCLARDVKEPSKVTCEPPLCDRDKLASKMQGQNDCGLPVNARYQSHHIIPCELFNDDVVKCVCYMGFDLNGVENGVNLPCCDYDDREAAYHCGRTPRKYREAIQTKLGTIKRVAGNNNAELLRYVRGMVHAVRKELCKDPDGLNKTKNIRKCEKLPAGSNCSTTVCDLDDD